MSRRSPSPHKNDARIPAAPTDLRLYRDHYARLKHYTDTLREGRCRQTQHFGTKLGETVAVFAPLFSPWNMEILFSLYMRDRLRFNQLKHQLAPVSSRVLTDKLNHLVAEGVVRRTERPRAVTYALTPKGIIIARHLHPLVFFLHNESAVPV